MLNLDKNQKYLLACSHGPDSMALLFMLKNEGYNFAVAHVNYHLREESDLEQKQLQEYCDQNSIQLYIKEVNESLGESNLEEKCRIIRYGFFKELVRKHDFYAVLVAHNEDDLIETYLMQKSRQNLVEFFGIKQNPIIFNVKIIRPVLQYTKQDLLLFCQVNGVEYSIDKTNLQDVFLRNKIRHQVVEKMSREERDEILKEIEVKNKELAELNEKLSKIKSNKVEDYNRLSDDEFLYAIVKLGRKKKPSFTMSRKQGLELRKIFTSDKANISVDVSGLTLVKSYDSFYLEDKDLAINYEYKIDSPTELETEYFYLDFRGDTSNRNVNLDDYPLTIRNAHSDDAYIIKGYAKEIRRLFIDWKMPLLLRKKWPVILNKEGKIIYIPRYQKDFIKEEKCNFYVK